MHRTTDRTDPLDASGDAGFIEFSDAAMANLDDLIEKVVSMHRDAVVSLARSLEADKKEAEELTIHCVEGGYNAVAIMKRRIDMLVSLKERGGIWA